MFRYVASRTSLVMRGASQNTKDTPLNGVHADRGHNKGTLNAILVANDDVKIRAAKVQGERALLQGGVLQHALTRIEASVGGSSAVSNVVGGIEDQNRKRVVGVWRRRKHVVKMSTSTDVHALIH